MIKFFRRIRFNLMEKNKTGKYVKYAIGEIVLVVIGILIALQINNANEDRKTRQAERSYLVRLVVDLEENKELWSERYTIEENRLEAANAYINYSFNKDKVDIRNVMPYFNSVTNWDDLHINQVTFQEMVSSGNFNLISNDSIKFKLQNLEKLYKTISNRWGNTKKYVLEVLSDIVIKNVNVLYSYPIDPSQGEMLSKNFTQEEKVYYLGEIMKQITVLFDDALFMNTMTLINTNAPLHLEEYKRAEAQVTELVNLIKADLGTDN
mgnify:CR=1 FL=1